MLLSHFNHVIGLCLAAAYLTYLQYRSISSGVLQCAKNENCTCTCVTCFGSPAGLTIHMFNATCFYADSAIVLVVPLCCPCHCGGWWWCLWCVIEGGMVVVVLGALLMRTMVGGGSGGVGGGAGAPVVVVVAVVVAVIRETKRRGWGTHLVPVPAHHCCHGQWRCWRCRGGGGTTPVATSEVVEVGLLLLRVVVVVVVVLPLSPTSGYPWSIPIRFHIFSYELSLIGTFLRWAPRDNCIGPA